MSEILPDELFDNAEALFAKLDLDVMHGQFRTLHAHLHEMFGFSLVQSQITISLLRRQAMDEGAPHPRELVER